jgi:hypothetical protein
MRVVVGRFAFGRMNPGQYPLGFGGQKYPHDFRHKLRLTTLHVLRNAAGNSHPSRIKRMW